MNEFRLLQDGGFVYRFVSKELNNNSTFTNSPTNVANHQSRDPLRRISNIKPLKSKKTIHKSCKLSDKTIRNLCKQMKESNTQDKQPSPGYDEDERVVHERRTRAIILAHWGGWTKGPGQHVEAFSSQVSPGPGNSWHTTVDSEGGGAR